MTATLLHRFRQRAAGHPDRPALRVLSPAGDAERVITWGEWGTEAARFAAALVADGHRAGQAVAVLADVGPLWPIADLGILSAGGVSVGVYPTSAPGQVEEILNDAGAVTVLVDTPEQLRKVLGVVERVPSLRRVLCAGGAPTPSLDLAAWLQRGEAAREAGAAEELDRRGRAITPETLAILIYTSGSTGEPKGARISHRYLERSAASIAEVLDLTEADTALSFLPYCHAAERVFGLYSRIHSGMEAGLLADHRHIWDAARGFAPTVFGGLPRFFEKAYEALRDEESHAVGAAREAWERTVRLGRERSRLRREGEAVPAELERSWRAVGAPLFEAVRRLFGARVRVATSGGAVLPEEVAEYLDALGLTVLGAYGLTEHLCVAFQRPGRYGFDGVGPTMPGSEVRIAEDGEILVRRSALTFDGYHGKPQATAEAFTADGAWLRTGDLGTLDERGSLRVTGRKKELIALSTGKKIAPAPIEARLMSHPWIGQAVLFGEGRKYVSALLVPRRSSLEAWARVRGADPEDPTLLENAELVAEVAGAVEAVNALFSAPERVRRFRLLPRELTAEAGELTPTLKIRRHVVNARYGALLESLYR
jgi:long-chain acyl-CoA synthetase